MSQFFSALYLKPLDDALSQMDIVYLRFQDDILALCKSKRQLNRCRRRMMEVLSERQLKLSRKKSRIGTITDSFHFLGIHYSLTQPENDTSVKHANDDMITPSSGAHYLSEWGGGKPVVTHQQHDTLRMTPHPRTLRRVRENVKWMVADQVSPAKIKNYFVHWVRWWVRTNTLWDFQTLVEQFISRCWREAPAAMAREVLHHYLTGLNTRLTRDAEASAA